MIIHIIQVRRPSYCPASESEADSSESDEEPIKDKLSPIFPLLQPIVLEVNENVNFNATSDPTKRLKAEAEGHTLMAGSFGPNDPLRLSGLLDMMRADDVATTAKKDSIICEVGRTYIRSHKEKHLLIVAKRNMRRLARLLMSVRHAERAQTLKMIDILKPHKFKALVKGTHDIAEYDQINRTFKSPSLALQMGTLIKSAINTAYSLEVQKERASTERLQHLQLTTLIETEWSQRNFE
ncbi:hypothetical protein FQR65_LT19865 [Abscondita terminalis]|nr:hypothetical protein FQR65_LT19865 [Abscondita terminalis]